MRRGLAGLGALAAVGALARVLAPDRFDTAVAAGADVVEQTPDPVVVVATALVSTVAILVLLVSLLRAYYWAWIQVEPAVTRLWNALLPESPVVRFGVGLLIMVAVFLIGPLVALSALDLFEDSEDPVEQQRTDQAGDNENATGNQTESRDTANVHTAAEPASPDEPPGRPVRSSFV